MPKSKQNVSLESLNMKPSPGSIRRVKSEVDLENTDAVEKTLNPSTALHMMAELNSTIPQTPVAAPAPNNDELRANQLLESILSANNDVYGNNFTLETLSKIDNSREVTVFTATIDNTTDKAGSNQQSTQDAADLSLPPPSYYQPPGQSQTLPQPVIMPQLQYQAQQPIQFPQPAIQGLQDVKGVPAGSIDALPSSSPQQQATVVVYSAPVTRDPITVNCPFCHQTVNTIVEKGPGFQAGLCAAVICCICWPLFWVPLVTDSCLDAKHTCPSCKNTLAIVKP